MLGVMEGPDNSSHLNDDESERTKEKVLKTGKLQSKSGAITDFFKSPPKTVVSPPIKPANLFGYFHQKPSSTDTKKQNTSPTSDPKTGEGGKHSNKSTKPPKKPLESRGRSTSKQSRVNGSQEEGKGSGDPTAAHLQGLISQLNQGRKDNAAASKGKRKTPPSPNASSADDFDSTPPSRKLKRPKVETRRRAKKVSSLLEDEKDLRTQEAAKCKKLSSASPCDSASKKAVGQAQPKCSKVEAQRSKKVFSLSEDKGELQTHGAVGCELAPSVVKDKNASASGKVGHAEEDRQGIQKDSEPEKKKNGVQVISYEDFLLSSEMDDGGGEVREAGDSRVDDSEGEEFRRNMVVLSESESEDDMVLLISPDPEERASKECRPEIKRKEDVKGVHESIPSEKFAPKTCLERATSTSDESEAMNSNGIEPSDESGGSCVEGERGRNNSEMRQDNSVSSLEGVVDDSSPIKSGRGGVVLHQTPKLVVEAVVHSPQSGSSQGSVSFRRKLPVTPQGRISNVALDDAENDISVIEVVTAQSKPLYSIFMKKSKGGKKSVDGERRGKEGGQEGEDEIGESADDFDGSPPKKSSPKKGKRGRRRKPKQDKKAGPKASVAKSKEETSGNEGEVKRPLKKRGVGRPRKIVSGEEENDKTRTKTDKTRKEDDKTRNENDKTGHENERPMGRPRRSTKAGNGKAVDSSEEASGEGRRTLRPRGSSSREQGKARELIEDGDDATEEAKEGSRSRGRAKITSAKITTKSVRAQKLLKKARTQKAQVLGQRSIGQGSLEKSGKLKLRVTLDPLDLFDKGKVIQKNLCAEAKGADDEQNREERKGKTGEGAEVTKKAPVKVAAMFTKEGRKSLAKKQQEMESTVEVHSLLSSSDDDCSADTVHSVPLNTPRRQQSLLKDDTELMVPCFPDVSHILQKEAGIGDQPNWWDLPAVDKSKLRIKEVDQSQPSVSELMTSENVLLERITLSHLEEEETPGVKFTGHPELSYGEQKAALDIISAESSPFPARRVFKRYLAKRKGEVPEPAKVKGDKGKPEKARESLSRKRKPEDNSQGRERKVRRSSRGCSVKEQKPSDVNDVSTSANTEEAESLPNDPSKLRDLLWSDKYQPTTSSEVLVGNTTSVSKLKTWLKEWEIKIRRIKKKEAKAMRGNNKSARASDDSESDFELSDADSGSEDEDDGLCNTFLITGPHGVGKTSSVYACAKEMGFKVIEVNASSKRVGRQILDDLGEATQSHQLTGQAGLKTADLARFFHLKTPPALAKPKALKPKMHKAFAAFVKTGSKKTEDQTTTSKTIPPTKTATQSATPKKPNTASQKTLHGAVRTPASKKCSQLPLAAGSDKTNTSGASLILFDEVDIVFDEDKGFLHAINTFMCSTKRPIILTTSDPRFGECLDGRYEHVRMHRPETDHLATRMQLLCLAENVRTSRQDMLNVVSHHGNDLRQCLHALQSWVNTGAMLSSWQQTGATATTSSSPRRKVCKLSLKRVKGSKDYSCLVEGDQSGVGESKSAPSVIESAQPTVHQGSALSAVGCPLDAQQNFLARDDGSPQSREPSDMYPSIRMLLRCGSEPVRNLERNILYQSIPDLPGDKQTPGDQSSSSPSKSSSEVRADDDKLKADWKLLHAKSLEHLSAYSDSIAELDVLERKTDLCTGAFHKGGDEWWHSNTYPSLDDASDDQASRWHLEDFFGDVRSAIEWENFSRCRRRLRDALVGSEGSAPSDLTPDPTIAGEQQLKMNPELSSNLNSLYETISRRLPRYALCSHRSVTLEYLPTLRSICQSEQLREAAQRKRRFLHYLDAVSFNSNSSERGRLASISANLAWRGRGGQEDGSTPTNQGSI